MSLAFEVDNVQEGAVLLAMAPVDSQGRPPFESKGEAVFAPLIPKAMAWMPSMVGWEVVVMVIVMWLRGLGAIAYHSSSSQLWYTLPPKVPQMVTLALLFHVTEPPEIELTVFTVGQLPLW
jgi:hypothetical protein